MDQEDQVDIEDVYYKIPVEGLYAGRTLRCFNSGKSPVIRIHVYMYGMFECFR